MNSPRVFQGSGSSEHAIPPENLRDRIVDEARRDAAAYVREFGRAFGHDGLDWLAEAWSDLIHDLPLTAEQAGDLWLVYWKAFNEETLKLASNHASPQ